MSKEYAHHIKIFSHDVLKQSKPYYKQVKRLILYKDNVPYKFSAKWEENNRNQ